MTLADNPKDFFLWDEALRRRANLLHELEFEKSTQKETARKLKVHASGISANYIRAQKDRRRGII